MRASQVADAMVLWRPSDPVETHILEKYTLAAGGKVITPFALQPLPYLRDPGFVAWPSRLANKTVLVVSPFVESIQQQIEKGLEKIWPDNLYTASGAKFKVVRMEQSAAKNSPGCDSMHTFHTMTRRIRSMGDFDVAIISAGAYGLPLAGYIKDDMNRSAIVTGGAGQLLFGLLGARWTKGKGEYDMDAKKYFNEHWMYPLPSDTPAGSGSLEKSAYFNPDLAGHKHNKSKLLVSLSCW